MKPDTQKLIDILRKVGYRATPGKVAILSELMSTDQPMKITELINKLDRTIDQATVYRVLESFAEHKLVRRVCFGDRSTRYELSLGAHHHHHLICEKCDLIEDVTICDERLEKKVLTHSKLFGKVKHHSVEFFGLCKKCCATIV